MKQPKTTGNIVSLYPDIKPDHELSYAEGLGHSRESHPPLPTPPPSTYALRASAGAVRGRESTRSNGKDSPHIPKAPSSALDPGIRRDDIPPHYTGHRERLRDRFIRGGADALQDYELLELILFLAIPRRDVKPLAKTLIAHYGSLAAVFGAPIEQLARHKGLTENSAAAIKTVAAAATHMIRADVMNRPVLSSWERLLDYVYAAMANAVREELRLLFLNKKNELIADEVQQTGTVDHTPAYPREIMKRALELGATAFIMVHNHPSGDPKPSKDDITLTNLVIDAARPFNITVHDHLIVARKKIFSFRNEGLI